MQQGGGNLLLRELTSLRLCIAYVPKFAVEKNSKGRRDDRKGEGSVR